LRGPTVRQRGPIYRHHHLPLFIRTLPETVAGASGLREYKSEAAEKITTAQTAFIFSSPSARFRNRLLSGPLYGRALQAPSGDLVTQRRRAPLYGIAGHELMWKASFRFDLTANIVVKAQNALVVQISNSHELSPTPLITFGF
jgi:hypothetical protein